jgi:hypothetical protein
MPPCNDEQRSQSALQSCNRARSVLTQKVRPEKDEKLIRDKPLLKTSSGQLPGLGLDGSWVHRGDWRAEQDGALGQEGARGRAAP